MGKNFSPGTASIDSGSRREMPLESGVTAGDLVLPNFQDFLNPSSATGPVGFTE